MEIYVENDSIILQKYEPACIFCNSGRGLLSYQNRNVCRDCVRKMADSIP